MYRAHDPCEIDSIYSDPCETDSIYSDIACLATIAAVSIALLETLTNFFLFIRHCYLLFSS